MGYYTYFSYQARINKDCPESIRNILKASFDNSLEINEDNRLKINGEELDSFEGIWVNFFKRFSVTNLTDDFICISCSFKDYEKNIEKFCRWIEPHVHYDFYQRYFGFFQGEDWGSEPVFITRNDKKDKIFFSLKEIIEECHYWR